jgi:hypothetical protein
MITATFHSHAAQRLILINPYLFPPHFAPTEQAALAPGPLPTCTQAMAELLAFAASISAFIQLADRVITLSKFYLEALEDCPRDIRVLFIEVSSLRGILESLAFFIQIPNDNHANTLFHQLAGPDGPIEGCRRSLDDLRNLLPRNNRSAGDRRHKMSILAQSLAWPLKETKARKLLQDVLQYKTSIIAALTSESA